LLARVWSRVATEQPHAACHMVTAVQAAPASAVTFMAYEFFVGVLLGSASR
jgi:hypothetical protein